MINIDAPPRQQLIEIIQNFDKCCYASRFLDEIDVLADKFIQDISKKGGDLLHDLDFDQDRPSDIGSLIDIIPSSLTYKNCLGQLPIHSAASSLKSVKFVPLLAQKGVEKQNIEVKKNKHRRGGLLVRDPTTSPSLNVLGKLASFGATRNTISFFDEHNPDLEILSVLEDLKESNLLLKQDIYRYDLICWSCFPRCQRRFNFFTKWDPLSLRNDDECYSVLLGILHADFNIMVKHAKSTRFKMALTAGMKHFPNELGLLFQEENHPCDAKGGPKSTFHRAVDILGEDRTLRLVYQSMPPSDFCTIPILHHVARYAPEHLGGFTKRYPANAFLRDPQNRTFTNLIIASGRTFKEDPMFYTRLTDEAISDKDMASGLYPFMLAASAKNPDLQTLNYLLTRSPSLL